MVKYLQLQPTTHGGPFEKMTIHSWYAVENFKYSVHILYFDRMQKLIDKVFGLVVNK